MNKAFLHFLLLVIPIGLVVGLNERYAPIFVRQEFGPGTEEQIERAFELAAQRPYQCLALGNSRMYRGLNPDKLSVPTFNFAHEDGSYNQYFYKLRYLEEKHVHFSTLILGTDYYQFSFLPSTRNHIYSHYFDPAYLADYADTGPQKPEAFLFRRDFFSQHNEAFNQFMSRKFSRTFPSVTDYLVKRCLGRPVEERRFMRDNGQYVVRGGTAFENDFYVRDGRRLPVQQAYFEKILDFCAARGIKVLIVMPPARAVELNAYAPGVIEEQDRYIRSKERAGSVFYLNYSRHPDYRTEDFVDIAHLTESASDRFSAMLNDDMITILKGGKPKSLPPPRKS